MKHVVENQPRLLLRQGEIVDILVESEDGKLRVVGVQTKTGRSIWVVRSSRPPEPTWRDGSLSASDSMTADRTIFFRRLIGGIPAAPRPAVATV